MILYFSVTPSYYVLPLLVCREEMSHKCFENLECKNPGSEGDSEKANANRKHELGFEVQYHYPFCLSAQYSRGCKSAKY